MSERAYFEQFVGDEPELRYIGAYQRPQIVCAMNDDGTAIEIDVVWKAPAWVWGNYPTLYVQTDYDPT